MLVTIGGLLIYLDGTQNEYSKKHSWLKSDIQSFQGKIDGMDQQTLAFSEAIEVWNSLPLEDRQMQGLRITDAKDLLDKLEKKYKLTGVQVSFSKPEDSKDEDLTTNSIVVSNSKVSITFKALTDEYVYNYIADIKKNFPGYIKLTSFYVRKAGEIDKGSLLQIAQGNMLGLVEAKIDFAWHDLQYNAPPPESEGGQ